MFQMQLLSTVLNDLFEQKLRILLVLCVLLSAFGIILSTDANRNVSRDLEALMVEQDELDVEWRHLILEQSALTEHNRIEALVDSKLNMHRPSATDEIVVKIE